MPSPADRLRLMNSRTVGSSAAIRARRDRAARFEHRIAGGGTCHRPENGGGDEHGGGTVGRSERGHENANTGTASAHTTCSARNRERSPHCPPG